MRRLLIIAIVIILPILTYAQVDKREVREGNRHYSKEKYQESEIAYRKALIKDSTSVAANYNLASALYRQQDFQGAKAVIDKLNSQQQAPNADAMGSSVPLPSEAHFNSGDISLQLKDYGNAVKSFREYLLAHPEDLEAKENYLYAKKMLQDQQNQDQQNQDQQNQDQNQQDNKDDQDNKDQNQDQKQDQNQPNEQPENQPQEQPKISPQQAQQMLNAIQAKEKETQDKVEKEKAAALKSRQKDKNW